jgi:hypothetical protein
MYETQKGFEKSLRIRNLKGSSPGYRLGSIPIVLECISSRPYSLIFAYPNQFLRDLPCKVKRKLFVGKKNKYEKNRTTNCMRHLIS